MSGREENKQKMESYIDTLIEDAPKRVIGYSKYIKDKSHNTRRQYVRSALVISKFLADNGIDIDNDKDVNNIKTSTLKDYMEMIRYKDGKEVSASYLNLQMCAMKNFFSYLEDEDIIIKNPATKVKVPRSSQDIKIVYLTPEEVGLIKKNIEDGIGTERSQAHQKYWHKRDKAIFQLLLHSGLRVSAMTEINIQDIDYANHCIRVTEKENITKDIFIDENTECALKEWQDNRKDMLNGSNTDALFVSKERTRITPFAVNNLIKKYTSNIDKKVTAHKLRSTFATSVYEQTGDIYVTSALLGHSSVETTKRYANISDDRKANAIKAIQNLY